MQRDPVRARRLAAVLVLALTSAGALLTSPVPAHAAGNPIVVENNLTGTGNWQLGSNVATDSGGQIKGYASATSVAQGSNIDLDVSVNPAQTYTIDIYRIGWYNGAGGRLLQHVGPLAGTNQGACPTNASTGIIVCPWSKSYTVAVPNTWTSGVYLARLINAQGWENYIVFVVRDGRPAALLYQQSVTTYQAYNNYPDNSSTGKSLYEYNSNGPNTIAGTARAVKVSFDRPYADSGAGQFLSWEINFVRWQEQMGYDVTYITDVDTHANGAVLLNSRGFLSVGHDEYWSKPMFDAAVAARDAGVNLGFFGANEVYWQIRFESSAGGVGNRIMDCYKNAGIDPVKDSTATVNWRAPPVNRPEQTLVGIQYTSSGDYANNADYVVTNSSHWAYAGTGFSDGSRVTRMVGYEMDRYMSGVALPPLTSRTLLSQSPYADVDGNSDYANSSIYQAPSTAWVFAAGTISWSWGLDDYSEGHHDAGIQRTTQNILNAFVNGAPAAPGGLTASAVSPSQGQPELVGFTRGDQLQDPAVPRRQHRVDPGRHQHHDRLRQHRPHSVHHLLLPGVGQ